MYNNNRNIDKAKKAKNDEFYTTMKEVVKELQHYKKEFDDKVVCCNCDDPRISNFFTYFMINFNRLNLKELICIGMKRGDLSNGVISRYVRDGKPVDLRKLKTSYLEGTGEFQSQEAVDILRGVDIVVTNPPFSLFRDYVSQLVELDKKFLIIGNLLSLQYKQVYQLFINDKIHTGYYSSSSMFYTTPDNQLKDVNSIWCHNLHSSLKVRPPLESTEEYSPEKYEQYDNLPDIIEIPRRAVIPIDYYDWMGVPVSVIPFLNKKEWEFYNTLPDCVLNGKSKFRRVIIKRKKRTQS